MIQANELRIGNLVNVPNESYPVKITSLDYVDGNVGVNQWDKFYFYNELVPIKLTDEWLEKLGFVRGKENRDRNVFYRNKFSFVLDGRFGMYDNSGKLNIISQDIEIVHQLQNLYFALTGKELALC